MAEIYFRELRAGDLRTLSENLCEGERMTLIDQFGPYYDALDLVAKNVIHSARTDVMSLVGEEDLVAAVGVLPVSMVEGRGFIWFAATEEAFKNPRVLVRAARRYIDLVKDEFQVLMGSVDARHEGMLRLVRLLGATVSKTPRVTDRGIPFHDYWKHTS